MIYQYFPVPIDWRDTYQPAALQLFKGHSPFLVESFYNPPWILPLLYPLALLPTKLGGAIWCALTLVVFTIAAIRFGACGLALLAIVFSYPLAFMLFYGQIDALVVLGYLLSPPLRLFLVLAKPQIGMGIALFWGVEAFRKGGFKGLAKLFLPIALAYGITTVLYGPWYLMGFRIISQSVNASLWPMSLPIGLVLLVIALRKRQQGTAVLASPFLAPYLGPHSWVIPLLGLLPNQWEVVAASAGLWVVAFLKGGWL